MGMRKDIEQLIEASYAVGRDGEKIAKRLIEAGLNELWNNGDLTTDHRIVPNGEGGSYHIDIPRELHQERDTLDPETEDAIREAADTFDRYAQDHLAKNPPQIAKARRNFDQAVKLYRLIDEEYAAEWPQDLQESDSAVQGADEPVESVVNAVAAIRAVLAGDDLMSGINDAQGLAFETIEQLLDRVMLVTDADIPTYIRTTARAAYLNKAPDTARVLDNLAEQIERGLHVGLEDEVKALREITDRIGAANVAAGWWSDANIDLRDCPYTLHVVAGKLMLVTSEVSEGMEGWRKSQKTILMDDHLPHRPMLEVELADAHIRLFDLGANVRFPNGQVLDVPGAIIEKLAYNARRPDHKKENREKDGGKAA